MFIKKITGIKNVGRFKSARVSGGNYEPFTLFYAGNGRGKTTLCAILRSLQLGDPKHVLRRKSFKAPADPEITLLHGGGNARFTQGKWDVAQPDIHIFDQQFVTENVHGGDQVDVEHRRNFYRIVVGPTGVALAADVDRLDAEASSKQTQIAGEKKVLEQHLPKGMTLEAFLKLPKDPDAASKLENLEKRLKAINDAAMITARQALRVPPLPTMPSDFVEVLATTIDDIAEVAASRIHAHMAQHELHKGGEAWLAQGLSHVREEACPFCAAPLGGNQLVEAYKGYFSQAYADHKVAVAAVGKQLQTALSDASALRMHQAYQTLAEDAQFWTTYCEHKFVAPAAASRILTEIGALQDAAMELMNAKMAAPLEALVPSAAFITAEAEWMATKAELEASAEGLVYANAQIDQVKVGNAAGDKIAVEAGLAALRTGQRRHSEPVVSLALNYKKLQDEKKSLVDDKDTKKAALDAYDETILSAYETDINVILRNFAAGFRLAKSAKNYVGKVPQSTYMLRFDTSDVDVTKAAENAPGFDTTMSAGDKNTFALAFFLAQLKRDSDLAKKLVVFDDPFTSLDDFRRGMTAKEIVRTGGKAEQTIVFSHDKHFLDTVKGLIHGVAICTMQISATSQGSSIEPWDIEWEVKEGYLQDHMRLQEYASGGPGDAGEMRKVMRPLLEQYIRYRFPNQWANNQWLGDMLAAVRADQTHPLTLQYDELDDINTYTATFHHDPNAPYNEDEVRAYAGRTADVVGGC